MLRLHRNVLSYKQKDKKENASSSIAWFRFPFLQLTFGAHILPLFPETSEKGPPLLPVHPYPAATNSYRRIQNGLRRGSACIPMSPTEQ